MESAQTSKKQYPVRPVIFLLVLTVLLGAALRLYRLGEESIWYDEGASLYLGGLVNRHLDILDPYQNNEAPLNAVFVKCWYAFISRVSPFPVISRGSDFLIRLWPCFWSLLAIPLLFFTGRFLLKDEWAALIAAFLFAISPFQIYYAQELRIYSFNIVIGILAIYWLMRAIEDGKRRYWAGMIAALITMVYGHYFAAQTILCFNVWFACVYFARQRPLWERLAKIALPDGSGEPPAGPGLLHLLKNPRQLRAWIVVNVILLVLISPAIYLAYSFKLILNSIKYPWMNAPTLKTAALTIKTFFAAYGCTPWAYWVLFLLAMALVVLGLLFLGRRQPGAALLLAILGFMPVAIGYLLWHNAKFSFYEHRIFILSSIPLTLLAAAGMRALSKPALTGAALALFVLFTLPCLGDFYRRELHPIENHRLGVWEKADLRSAAAYIEKKFLPGDLIVTANHFNIYPLYHYLDLPIVRVAINEIDAQAFIDSMGNELMLRQHGLTARVVQDAVANAKRIWFVQSFGITFEWQPHTLPVREWLDAHWHAAERDTFKDLTVSLYTAPKPAPAPSAS